MSILVGQSIFHDKKKKTVVRIFKNTEGGDVVEWQSKNQKGACIPSLWIERKNGVDETKRRN